MITLESDEEEDVEETIVDGLYTTATDPEAYPEAYDSSPLLTQYM